MTPTEQDKELRMAIVNYRIKCDYYLSDRDEGVISQEEYERAISSELDSVVELITADRKRVALEARVDELIQLSQSEVMFFNNDYKQAKLMRDRIAELKAQRKEI